MKNHSKELKAEFYLPQVINELIHESKVEVAALVSTDQWFGMTYPDDKITVKEQINKKIAAGAYPTNLWI